MDLETVADQSKVVVKPNFMPSYQPVASLFSSNRVHAMCQTPHPHSSQSLTLTKQIVTPYLVMGGVLLLRIEIVANSSTMCLPRERLYSLEQRAPTDYTILINLASRRSLPAQ